MAIDPDKKFSAALVYALAAGLLAMTSLPPVAQASAQQSFATPEAAGKALIAADRASGSAQLLGILGPDAADLISSGDPVADARGRKKFAAAYDVRHAWRNEGDKKILEVGPNNWPLPIPLVRDGGNWRFDTKAGRQEILDRRIGHNEARVVATCRSIVVAQHEYADLQMAATGKRAYAEKFLSSPGTHNGLFWQVAKGGKESPLGPLVAKAADEGYPAHAQAGEHAPFHGYYYRILKSQGPSAPGGAKSYYAHGALTRGFALLAYPAKYGDSGVKTFLVDQTGIVYEKDLGPKTGAIVKQMTAFNPDDSWKIPQALSLND